jgi:hypothetical protein
MGVSSRLLTLSFLTACALPLAFGCEEGSGKSGPGIVCEGEVLEASCKLKLGEECEATTQCTHSDSGASAICYLGSADGEKKVCCLADDELCTKSEECCFGSECTLGRCHDPEEWTAPADVHEARIDELVE